MKIFILSDSNAVIKFNAISINYLKLKLLHDQEIEFRNIKCLFITNATAEELNFTNHLFIQN